tara:strand:- start:6608 stop:6973 length:366 start_codon:yes stop_codon:yes gene_type:complete
MPSYPSKVSAAQGRNNTLFLDQTGNSNTVYSSENQGDWDSGTIANPEDPYVPGEFGPGGPEGYAFAEQSMPWHGPGGVLEPPPPPPPPSLTEGAGGYDTSMYGAIGKRLCDPRDPNCYGQR